MFTMGNRAEVHLGASQGLIPAIELLQKSYFYSKYLLLNDTSLLRRYVTTRFIGVQLFCVASQYPRFANHNSPY